MFTPLASSGDQRLSSCVEVVVKEIVANRGCLHLHWDARQVRELGQSSAMVIWLRRPPGRNLIGHRRRQHATRRTRRGEIRFRCQRRGVRGMIRFATSASRTNVPRLRLCVSVLLCRSGGRCPARSVPGASASIARIPAAATGVGNRRQVRPDVGIIIVICSVILRWRGDRLDRSMVWIFGT